MDPFALGKRVERGRQDELPQADNAIGTRMDFSTHGTERRFSVRAALLA